MAPMVPRRGLIFLCLLHLCVQGVQGDVNTAVLAKMAQYLYDKVQPNNQKQQTDAQYAIAISVPQDQCTPEEFDIQTVFSSDDAKKLKDKLSEGNKCLLNEGDGCTSGNVIATRPDRNNKPVEHAEHVLLYPLGNSPMDKLLAKAGQKSCVVFYSYYSPCVKTCIQSEENILEGLSNWINKNKDGNNAFVFQEIWNKDISDDTDIRHKKDLNKEFLKINEKVPLYQCKIISNVMKCQKCVDNQSNNVLTVNDFCLPEKKLI